MNGNGRKSDKVLIGAERIMAYCHLSRPMFKKFVALGLPAVIFDGKWYAHADNLDEFFRRITAYSMKEMEIPEEAE